MAEQIPEQLISEIISANDLGEVAANYVALKRSGNDLTGLCPFHREKTPSFHIATDKQLYYCFGCGVGGNVVGFVEKIENLDYVDAIKFLAERVNIRIPETGFSERDKERYQKKQTILKINRETAVFFRQKLIEGNNKGLEYAKKRGISDNMITAFGLGYAPDSWSALAEHLEKLGFSKSDIVLSGVCGKSEKGRVYDRFRNRLMFPIIDVRGNLLAFSGRTLGDDKAKYVNSPETMVYSKRSNLFNLNLAKKSSPTQLILVEGNMDVLSLYQYGITNAVASLGTAFTPEQSRLIARYVHEVILCFDTDEPGIKATNRAIEAFESGGIKVKILTLPEGKDPDEFIKKNGAEMFRSLVAEAKSVLGYRLDMLQREYNLSDETARVDFASEAAKLISTSKNEVERDLFTQKISEITGISQNAMQTQVRKGSRQNARKEQRAAIRDSVKQNVRIDAPPRLIDAQRKLVSILATDASVFAALQPEIDNELFSDSIYTRIISYLAEGNYDCASLINKFEGDEKSEAAAALSMAQHYENSLSAARDILSVIKKEKYNLLIEKAMKDGDVAQLNRLIMEKNKH